MTLTKKLVYAICADAYTASRKAGKTSEQACRDHDAKFDELFRFIGGVEGWIDLEAA